MKKSIKLKSRKLKSTPSKKMRKPSRSTPSKKLIKSSRSTPKKLIKSSRIKTAKRSKKLSSKFRIFSSDSSGNVPKRKRLFSRNKTDLRVSHNSSVKSKRKLIRSGYLKTFTKRLVKNKIKIGHKLASSDNSYKIKLWSKYLEFIHKGKIKSIEQITFNIFSLQQNYTVNRIDNLAVKLPLILNELENVSERYIITPIDLREYLNENLNEIFILLKQPDNIEYFNSFLLYLINENVFLDIPLEILLLFLIYRRDLLPHLEDIKKELLYSTDHENTRDHIYERYSINLDSYLENVFEINGKPITLNNIIDIDYKGHMNILLIDKYTREIELFEPHGSGRHYTVYMFGVDYKLKTFFKKNTNTGFNYIENASFCPEETVQTIHGKSFTELLKSDNGPDTFMYQDTGYCAIWCLWYIDMRLLNDHLSRGKLLNIIGDMHTKNKELSHIIIQNFWSCMRIYLKYKTYNTFKLTDSQILKEINKCREPIYYSQIKI